MNFLVKKQEKQGKKIREIFRYIGLFFLLYNVRIFI